MKIMAMKNNQISNKLILLDQNHLDRLTSFQSEGTLKFENHGFKTLLCCMSPRQKPQKKVDIFTLPWKTMMKFVKTMLNSLNLWFILFSGPL